MANCRGMLHSVVAVIYGQIICKVKKQTVVVDTVLLCGSIVAVICCPKKVAVSL